MKKAAVGGGRTDIISDITDPCAKRVQASEWVLSPLNLALEVSVVALNRRSIAMNTVSGLRSDHQPMLTRVPDPIYMVCSSSSHTTTRCRAMTRAVSHDVLTTLLTRLGWGVLCVAGGGAYYFAKREINADRAARHQAEMQKKSRIARLENSSSVGSSSPPKPKPKPRGDGSHVEPSNMKGLDHAGNPSSEISEDMAPVGHAPENAEQRIREKSKYEAAEPYRSKKGNRFS